ncbi:MAG: lipopolysaccharide biosynthesis protein [Microgenomates group bacterium]
MQSSADRDQIFKIDDLVNGQNGRVGVAAIVILAFAAVKMLFQLGSTAVLARLIPPAEHGVVAMAMPAMAIAIALSQFGLAQAVIQRREISHDLVSTLFWVNAGLGIFFAVLVAIIGFPAATFYNEPRVTPVFAALGVSVLFSAILAQYMAILRRRMRIWEIEISGLIALFGSFGVAVIAALAGAGYWALVLQQVLLPIINFAILLFNLRWLPSSPFKMQLKGARDALHFGGHMSVFGIVTLTAHSAATVIAGKFFGDAMTGAYYRSWTLANLPQRQILTALSGAFTPGLSRLQDDPDAFADLFARMITRTDLIMMPISVLMAITADLIVEVLLGPGWALMVPILAWMSLLSAQAAITNGCNWALTAKGETKVLMNFGFVTAGLILAPLLIGVHFGLVAMTALYMTSLVVLRLPMLCWLVARYTGIGFYATCRPFVMDMAYAIFAGAVLWAIRSQLPQMPAIIELILCTILVGLLYVLRIVADPSMRLDAIRLVSRAGAKLGKRG